MADPAAEQPYKRGRHGAGKNCEKLKEKSQKANDTATTMTMLIMAQGEGAEERQHYGIQKNSLETSEIYAQAKRAEPN